MVSRKSPSLLALAAVALVVSSSFASKDAPAMSVNDVVIQEEGRPYCEVMVPCSIPNCTSLCVGKGLSSVMGFCTFMPDFQFYCCCPVP
ncbi:hypothetical protein QOZ80_2BG0205520 [Eleusine coracana subsp. coracana]|nr:hypothetical protein QOZ80_2BG0205520 [Eleusine coracana subsp. coracana]